MGLVYKSLALSWVILLSSALCAEEYQHSLNVGWSYSEDSVSGNDKTIDLAPEGGAFFYSYSLSDNVSLSLSYKNPKDNKALAQGFRLSRDSMSYGASVNIALENDLSLSASYFYEEKDTLVWSPTSQNRYEETFDVEELEILLLKDWYFDDFAITPALAFAYQNSQLDLSQNFLFRQNVDGRAIPISARESEKDKGVYSTAGIDLSMFSSLSQQVVMIPSLSIAWIEPLIGDVTSTANARVINQSRTPLSSSHNQDDYEELSGQGVLGMGLLFILDRYSVNGSYSRALSGDEKQQSWQISLGVEF